MNFDLKMYMIEIRTKPNKDREFYLNIIIIILWSSDSANLYY